MNKNKAITIIVSLIIILGIVITLTTGFNISMMTKKHNQILLSIGKDFEIEDIKNMAKEVLEGQELDVKKVGEYEQEALISASQISDEQKNSIIGKIDEKYGTELKGETINVSVVPRTIVRSYIMPYITTFIWATSLIVVYFLLRYKKIGMLKTLIQTILGMVIFQLVVFSIIAIARIPVGSNIVGIVFITYAISIFGLATMFEKRLQTLKAEEAEKNKE